MFSHCTLKYGGYRWFKVSFIFNNKFNAIFVWFNCQKLILEFFIVLSRYILNYQNIMYYLHFYCFIILIQLYAKNLFYYQILYMLENIINSILWNASKLRNFLKRAFASKMCHVLKWNQISSKLENYLFVGV